MTVRIVTDAVADLPPALAERWGITTAPIYVTVAGETRAIGNGEGHDWFYAALERGASPRLQTASPSVADIAALFRRLAEEGARQIVGLFTASTVSSTADHARLAAREVAGVEVRIVETAQVSLGEGLLVLEAAQAAATGASAAEIAEHIEALRPRTLLLGVLPSLAYLRRGGRVNHVVALVGDLFRIKPIIFFYEGDAGLWGKVRTYHRAIEMLEPLVQASRLRRLAVLHSRAPAAALDDFYRRIAAHFPGVEVPLVEVGPVFASHVGPGAMGLAFIGTESQAERYPKLARITAASETSDRGTGER